MSQYNSIESALNRDFIFLFFVAFLKKRLVNDFIFACYILLRPNTTQNCRKTHSHMIFHSELF